MSGKYYLSLQVFLLFLIHALIYFSNNTLSCDFSPIFFYFFPFSFHSTTFYLRSFCVAESSGARLTRGCMHLLCCGDCVRGEDIRRGGERERRERKDKRRE